MKNLLKITAVICFALLLPRPAAAVPHIDGHVDVRLHADKFVEREEEELYRGYTDSHIKSEIFLYGGLSIFSELLLEGEPYEHEHGDESEEESEEETDSFFPEHELELRRLSLKYKQGFGIAHFSVKGGKFIPVVHFDEHYFPGVFGYRITHEYEMDPRIGFGGSAGVNSAVFGKHSFDFSVFQADTTVFGRGDGRRLRKRDGGVSNTGDLSSFALSVGGGDFYLLSDNFIANLLDGFSYRFGYAKQAKGRGNERDESRFSFSARSEMQIAKDLSMNLVGEYVNISHLDGEKSHDRSQISVAAGFDWKKWTLAGGFSVTDNSAEGAEGKDGSSFNFSVLRKMGNVKIGIGYRRVKEEGETNGRIGTFIGYHGSFSSLGGGHDDHSGHAH